MDNNYGGNDRENFQPNGENGGFENGRGDGDGSENKKPWFLTPSVTVPKEYNPYRDGESVFEETVKKNPGAFKGASQLENEHPVNYYYRRRWEWGFARSEAKKSLGKSSRYIAAILLMYLFFSNFFVMCFHSVMSESVFETVATLVQYLAVAPTLLLVANIGLKHKTKSFFKKPQCTPFYVIKWSVICFGITYAVSVVSNLFFGLVQVLGVNVNSLTSTIPDNPMSLMLSFFALVVGAPLFEEILFRGVLLTHHLKYGCWHAIIVGGILFGLFHQNHEQMFFAAVSGIIFGYIDVKAGSIIPSIVAHVSINLYSFIMTLCLYFTNYNETLSDPSVMLDGPAFAVMMLGILETLIYAFIIVSIIMLIYEIKRNKSDFDLPKGDSFLTEKEKTTRFFTHPVMVTLLVFLAISIYVISFSPPITVAV